MNIPPINFSLENKFRYSASRKLLCSKNLYGNVNFQANGHNTAKVGAGLIGAVMGAFAGMCAAGPLGAIIGATTLGALTASSQQSENDEMDKGDTSSYFDGRDESARV